jgi:hypothetical protein
MLSSDSLCFPLGLYVVLCYPLGPNDILWEGIWFLGPNVILRAQVRMLSSTVDRYVILWVRMISSGYVCYPLTVCIIFLVRMTYYGKVYCPMGPYAILCVCMLFSVSPCYCCPMDRYVVFWVGMVSSGLVCCPLGLYVILWVRLLSSKSVNYPLTVYVFLWICLLSSGKICCPPSLYVILRVCMISSG